MVDAELTKKENQADSQKPEKESIRIAMNSDQPAKKDFLGFEPYVEAIYYFLTDPNTKPPLTLSIEGKWGYGKSSFMEQLEKKLSDKDELTVPFNAWRHDREESLWAAFAINFMHEISSRQSFKQRASSYINLYFQRFSWKNGRIDLLRGLAVWSSFLLITGAIISLFFLKGFQWINTFSQTVLADGSSLSQTALSWLIGLGGGAGLIGIIISVMIKLKSVAGSPLDFDFNKYFKSPDYENRVAFIETFHKDFEKIVNAYAGINKIYVFIDDLDRCEVPKASDLMQAINLMISYDPRLIFIIGMDREKVAASLAVKHEKLFPYLYSFHPSTEGRADDTEKSDEQISCPEEDLNPEYVYGLRYGYEFIEKFIQVPFSVPVPTEADLDVFLDQISAPAAIPEVEQGLLKNIPETIKRSIHRWWSKLRGTGMRGQPEDLKDQKELTVEAEPEGKKETKVKSVEREIVELLYHKDSEKVRSIILMAAPALENNPRRIKQFVNLFRLRVYIAKKTGLFDLSDGPSGDENLTLEQLGKFVAISLRWPLLLKEIETDPELLLRLQEESINPGSQAVKQWSTEKKLMDLLSFKHLEKDYNLSTLKVSRLLHVSPPAIFLGKTVDFLGISFVQIPAGEFMMGSEEFDVEKPVHNVTIKKSFYLGIYPVTQEEWKEIMGANPSYFKGDNLPVEMVSWNDVQDFLNELNKKESTGKYRLPSEAEWEYAVRAGTNTRYSFGADASELEDHAWYSENSEGRTHPVGQKKPNPWGLYDMHGNVGEWVQDEIGAFQVNRGGSWNADARGCWSAFRYGSVPRDRDGSLGFRLLREL